MLKEIGEALKTKVFLNMRNVLAKYIFYSKKKYDFQEGVQGKGISHEKLEQSLDLMQKHLNKYIPLASPVSILENEFNGQNKVNESLEAANSSNSKVINNSSHILSSSKISSALGSTSLLLATIRQGLLRNSGL